MDAHDGGASPELDCPWIERSGYFQRVVGYRAAQDLLLDKRIEADFLGLIEGLGVTSGPLWEASRTTLQSLNGEEHRRIRSLVAGHFTPKAVERVRPLAASTAADAVASLAPLGSFELVSAFANRYVAQITCELVGFPPDGVERCAAALEMIGAATRDLANRTQECAEGIGLLVDYARDVLADRRDEPVGDLLSSLAASVVEGELPEDVALTFVATLLSAGHEPTVNQLGLVVLSLGARPEVWESIGSGQLSVSRAVEELLRFRSTNQGLTRRVAQGVTYRGVTFRPGQHVLIALAAANHDPTQFPAPDDLDPDANEGSHLAFGFGPHYCLGAALARLQLQEALRALTRALTCPVIEAVEMHEGTGLVGPARLELSFEARH